MFWQWSELIYANLSIWRRSVEWVINIISNISCKAPVVSRILEQIQNRHCSIWKSVHKDGFQQSFAVMKRPTRCSNPLWKIGLKCRNQEMKNTPELTGPPACKFCCLLLPRHTVTKVLSEPKGRQKEVQRIRSRIQLSIQFDTHDPRNGVYTND